MKERVDGREKVGFPPVPSPLVTVIWLAVPVSVRAETPLVPLDERMPIRFWKVTATEVMRFVDEAVVAVIIVVLAYGNVDAVEVVAVKYPAVAELPSADAPSTESFAYGEVVPIPTLPEVKTVKIRASD